MFGGVARLRFSSDSNFPSFYAPRRHRTADAILRVHLRPLGATVRIHSIAHPTNQISGRSPNESRLRHTSGRRFPTYFLPWEAYSSVGIWPRRPSVPAGDGICCCGNYSFFAVSPDQSHFRGNRAYQPGFRYSPEPENFGTRAPPAVLERARG